MFLVDGFARGTWRVAEGRLQIDPFTPLGRAEAKAVAAEGEALLAFTA
jgi:hypothetical protein